MIESPDRARHDGAGGVAGDPPLFQKKSVPNFCRGHWLQNSPYLPFLHLLAMPTLPKSLAAVQSAVASALLSSEHNGNLYIVMDVTDALIMVVDVKGNAAITTKVDANLPRRAFIHPDNQFVLQYESYFDCQRNKHVLYARRPVRTARNECTLNVVM